jgi:hypothetical protein
MPAAMGKLPTAPVLVGDGVVKGHLNLAVEKCDGALPSAPVRWGGNLVFRYLWSDPNQDFEIGSANLEGLPIAEAIEKRIGLADACERPRPGG